jgi:hypothetical protein
MIGHLFNDNIYHQQIPMSDTEQPDKQKMEVQDIDDDKEKG